jgi:murein DD-endopeptidase MepM/ murein hydrolase activator NlpD
MNGFHFEPDYFTKPSVLFNNSPIPSLPCYIKDVFDSIRTRSDGTKTIHPGQDMGGSSEIPVNTPVVSMTSGIVYDIRNNATACTIKYPDCAGNKCPANFVAIKDPLQCVDRYVHIKPAGSLKKGDPISVGQIIGYIDDSGCKTAHHLHMGVICGGVAKNFIIVPCSSTTIRGAQQMHSDYDVYPYAP